MRVNIPTGGKPVKDKDIKALYLMQKAMEICSDEKMRTASIKFITSKWKLNQ